MSNPISSRSGLSFDAGQILAGKYRVERVLGRGGMGVVLAVRHMMLEELFAMKLLLPEYGADAGVVERFAREGRAAAKIRSEHVARVFDAGRLEDGSPYLAMEYLDGFDLGAELRARGPFPVAQAVDFILQACEAIAEAHALGIIHRDLKPTNLFLSRRLDSSACIKVLDFGISKLKSSHGQSLTGTHAVVGSSSYMPPEQLDAAKHVDARADIWSLGVTLYQLLSGKLPFTGRDLPQVMFAILSGSPPPLVSVAPSVPPEVDRIVMQCLRKAPDERYRDLAAFATALAPWGTPSALVSAERIAIVLRGATMTVDAPSIVATTPPTTMPVVTSRPRNWLLFAMVALVLLAMAGGAAWHFLPTRAVATTVLSTDPSGAVPPGSLSVASPSPVASGVDTVATQPPVAEGVAALGADAATSPGPGVAVTNSRRRPPPPPPPPKPTASAAPPKPATPVSPLDIY